MTELQITNTNPVERIYINDSSLKPQTITHHKARYAFANNIQTPGGIALDLACGTGYGTKMLEDAGYDAWGIDIDKESIEYAKKKYPECDFVEGDLTSISLAYPPASLITLFEAIEHVPFREGLWILSKIKDVLAYDGTFILSTPRDINDKYNRMHLSEWPYYVLKNELGSLFRDVRIYGQDWDTAIIDEENVRNNDFYIAVCKK